jgi:N utilization substance protein B
MGSRRRAREQALQILYQVDAGAGDLEEVLRVFWDEEPPVDDEGVLFTGRLARGVTGAREELDQVIEAHSINWKLHRMPAVDRNILRLAVYEILHCDDIPTMVSINEAIELGKHFSTGESGAFINGILDKISRNEDPEPGEPG